jgi:hypothetical protein
VCFPLEISDFGFSHSLGQADLPGKGNYKI